MRDNSGFTPLQQAWRASTLGVTALLVQRGTDSESSHAKLNASSLQGFYHLRLPFIWRRHMAIHILLKHFLRLAQTY